MMICRTAPRKGGSPISKRFLGITHEPPRGSRPLNPISFSALAWVSLEGSYGLLRPPPVGRKSHYPSRSWSVARVTLPTSFACSQSGLEVDLHITSYPEARGDLSQVNVESFSSSLVSR